MITLNLNFFTPATLVSMYEDLLYEKNSLIDVYASLYSREEYMTKLEEIDTTLRQIAQFYLTLTGENIGDSLTK